MLYEHLDAFRRGSLPRHAAAQEIVGMWSMGMDIKCLTCGHVHDVERESRGGEHIEMTVCSDDKCTLMLCEACPQFACDGCGLLHCLSHKVDYCGLFLCPVCVASHGYETNEYHAALAVARDFFFGENPNV